MQPVLTAVLLYIALGKNMVLHMTTSFEDAYEGKTITLDVMKDEMLAMYPTVTHKVVALYERILDHLQSVLTDRHSYEVTLHNVLRDFHAEPSTSIAVQPAVRTQDAITVDEA